MAIKILDNFTAVESGQGITEYGAILAFIAVLIGLVLSLPNGSLQTALSSAFSMVASQLSALVSSVNLPTPGNGG